MWFEQCFLYIHCLRWSVKHQYRCTLCKNFPLISASHRFQKWKNSRCTKLPDTQKWEPMHGSSFSWFLVSAKWQKAPLVRNQEQTFLRMTSSSSSFLQSRLTSLRLKFPIATVQRHAACGWNESNDRMPRRWLWLGLHKNASKVFTFLELRLLWTPRSPPLQPPHCLPLRFLVSSS